MSTVTIGNETITIERPSGRKASRALALLRAISKTAPELQSSLARFTRDYERENVIELDRAQARLRFPPRPIINEKGDPVLDEHGEPILAPSPVDRMTDEDWERAGHVLRLPKSPNGIEVTVALLDRGLEVAEEHVYKLIALFTIPNAEVKRAWRAGTFDEALEARADELLDDVPLDELLELAVVVAEVLDSSLSAKVDALGDRLGNLRRLIGLRQPTTPTTEPTSSSTSTDGPSSSTPTLSTDAPASTDGAPTSPSTPPSTSSSSSPLESTPTPELEPTPS